IPTTALALNLSHWNVVERTINGKTEINKVGPGKLCLYPAGTELKVRWERTHTIVLVGITNALLETAASDISDRPKKIA
ncbi:hypothetical protein, partial [Klebsiella pneumoniae]|uniref:hypothetical protein n=1 Tax=Klebsiella pneumoniae TaxID=573 RepID=UPI003B97EC8F